MKPGPEAARSWGLWRRAAGLDVLPPQAMFSAALDAWMAGKDPKNWMPPGVCHWCGEPLPSDQDAWWYMSCDQERREPCCSEGCVVFLHQRPCACNPNDHR